LNHLEELELWKKGQLQADEDEENEDPTAVTAIVPTESSIEANLSFGISFQFLEH